LIDRREIMDFSREFGLNANVIEKDYVIGWVLAGIANHPELDVSWVFKGGTRLKKCYFETYCLLLDITLMNLGGCPRIEIFKILPHHIVFFNTISYYI